MTNTERTGRAGLWVALGLAAAGVLAWALVSASGEGSADAPPRSSRVRLIERLADARIESPLADLELAADLAAFPDAPRERLLDEDCEALDPAARGWPGVRVEGAPGTRALTLDGLGATGGALIGWRFDVGPGAYLRFARRARSAREAYADFVLVESSEPLGADAGRSPVELYMAGRDAALRLHWPEAVEEGGAWHAGETWLRTTEETRSVVVMLRSKGIMERSASGLLAFDDLVLERVTLQPSDELALFAGRRGRAGAEGDVARFVQRGRFLPLHDPETVRPPFEGNFAVRDALLAPGGTRFAFPLEAAEGMSLRFAAGLARESQPGSSARFRVSLEVADAPSRALFEAELSAREVEWHWHEGRVDLAQIPEGARLILFTETLTGTPLPLWANPTLARPGDGAPPVILIAVDTLRADRLPSYGYARGSTPALDALAADGVRFEHVASNSNWTCPSFASILTGLTPSRHGVDSYGPATPLPSGLLTLAELFQAAGRETRAIAYKAPLYDGGYDQGFDVSLNVPREAVRAESNLDAALAWLGRDGARDSFLFLHFNDPHQPFTQPDDWRHGAGSIELPMTVPNGPGRGNEPAWRETVSALYDGEVSYVDDAIGRFLARLRTAGVYEEATIVFVADHGEELWERGSFGHGGVGLGDELVRVPLIVKPGRGAVRGFEPGRVVREQVSAFDAMPTLIELAGLPALPDLDARSLVPLVRGAAQDTERFAVSETSLTAIALRSPRWKYVLRWPQRAQTRESLFDLAADPGEGRDVARELPRVAAELRVAALDYLLAHRPGPFVVVLGPPAGSVDLQVVGAGGAETYLGPRPRTVGEALSFAGNAAAKVWLVASLDGAATDLELRGVERAGDPARYRRGDLADLLADEYAAPRAWIFEGPPRTWSSEARSDVDAGQLETLRALGYAR